VDGMDSVSGLGGGCPATGVGGMGWGTWDVQEPVLEQMMYLDE
jgi:hypothetical protein